MPVFNKIFPEQPFRNGSATTSISVLGVTVNHIKYPQVSNRESDIVQQTGILEGRFSNVTYYTC